MCASRCCPSHTEDSISFLRKEEVRLFLDTTKCEIKSILIHMMLLPEMDLVLDEEAPVCASLSVSLYELAPATFAACAVSVLVALIDILRLTHVKLILRVQVIRSAAVAVAPAWDGRDTASCVHYQ